MLQQERAHLLTEGEAGPRRLRAIACALGTAATRTRPWPGGTVHSRAGAAAAELEGGVAVRSQVRDTFTDTHGGVWTKGKYVVIAASEMEWLAENLERKYPHNFKYYPTSWGRFPDQTDHIRVGGFETDKGNQIADSHILFLANFSSNDTTMSQFHVLTMLGESFARSLTICLPFYPTGTMERVTEEGVVATANTTAKMFSHLPRGGVQNRLMVYDMHALQNRFYFDGGTLASLHTAFPLIVDKVRELQDSLSGDIAIAFPDEGAEKRFAHFFKKAFPAILTIHCGKRRDKADPSKRSVHVIDGDARGKTVIIVDDMVQTGGTLAECAKVLSRQGATSVCAFCTHAVFPRDSWRRFAKGGDRAMFKKFWVTNTNPTVTRKLPTGDCFEVLDIIDLVYADLFSQGRSLRL